MNYDIRFFFGVKVLGISLKKFSQQKVLAAQNDFWGVNFRSFSGQNISPLIVTTDPKKFQKIIFIDYLYAYPNGQEGSSLSLAETLCKVKIIVCRRLIL